MKDVTDTVEFGEVDDEMLPLRRCVCGQTFLRWTFVLSIYSDGVAECPNCGRKFVFSNKITIYELEDGDAVNT
jgi:DNA-directed RNA polymerase subunit RPC12/RpoP